MKYYSRLKVYKANNVTFNPSTMNAYSYNWWRFVARIEGKIIFNDYRYSISTSKHQRKVLVLLNQLGIKIDQYVSLANGIKGDSLQEIYNQHNIEAAKEFIENERKKITKAERAKFLKRKKKFIVQLEGKLTPDQYSIEDKSNLQFYNKDSLSDVLVDDSFNLGSSIFNYHLNGLHKLHFYV